MAPNDDEPIYEVSPFSSASEDAEASARVVDSVQGKSSTYRLAYTDQDFLLRDDLRSVRLQLEFLKPELMQQDEGIDATIVIFGSARIPDQKQAQQQLEAALLKAKDNPEDQTLQRQVNIAQRVLNKCHYYEEARKLSAIITRDSAHRGTGRLVVITGGGPGIMEAANRGAMEVGGKSIGLNIVLPFEQHPNPYITPELCFQFHYFALRKMHFLKRARSLVAFPGGFGTLDELFETLTLIQTRKIKPVPVLLFGSEYWRRIINFDVLVEEGAIDEKDLDLFEYVDSAEDAWRAIKTYYEL